MPDISREDCASRVWSHGIIRFTCDRIAHNFTVCTCKSDAAQFAWTLKAPDAQLFDKDGKPFGKLFAAPSWEANDGSRVSDNSRNGVISCVLS